MPYHRNTLRPYIPPCDIESQYALHSNMMHPCETIADEELRTAISSLVTKTCFQNKKMIQQARDAWPTPTDPATPPRPCQLPHTPTPHHTPPNRTHPSISSFTSFLVMVSACESIVFRRDSRATPFPLHNNALHNNAWMRYNVELQNFGSQLKCGLSAAKCFLFPFGATPDQDKMEQQRFLMAFSRPFLMISRLNTFSSSSLML